MLQLIPAILLMLLSSSGPLDRSQQAAWPEALRILGLDRTDEDGACAGAGTSPSAILKARLDSRPDIAAAIIRWLTTPLDVNPAPAAMNQEPERRTVQPIFDPLPIFHANHTAHPFRAGPVSD